MLTRISKILAVAFAVGSIAFMGFAIAITFGEPEMSQALSDPAFDAYTVIKQEGAGGQWEAKRGRDGSSVATAKALPDVMVKVLAEVDQTNKQDITLYKQRQTELQTKRDELVAARLADELALQQYEKNLRERLVAVRAEVDKTSTDVITATSESQKLELQVAARREDVFRLKQQVRELDVDIYRLQQIEAQLENLQVQLTGELQRNEERKGQLESRLGGSYAPSVQQ
ncbi:MAG: hypothetical protein KDA58_04120 [Planctomycetaceae bacterium]|nr:hypothetical protein [Planctomycetaceae bacterium]